MRAFLIILGILVWSFVLVRLGWPAPILIVPGLLILCGLRVFGFTRSETFNARLCLRLGAFLLLAELIAWLFAQPLFWLRDNETDFFTSNGIVAFLSDTDALRVFWAVVAGLAVTALVALILLIPIWVGNTRLAARGPGVPAGAAERPARQDLQFLWADMLATLEGRTPVRAGAAIRRRLASGTPGADPTARGVSEALPREADQRTLIVDAGLAETYIAFDARADNTWAAILREAQAQTKVEAVIAVAVERYPQDPGLREAVKAYRSATTAAAS